MHFLGVVRVPPNTAEMFGRPIKYVVQPFLAR